jgi:GTP-binding protein
MRITEASLVVRASRKADFPRTGLPEFAFVGRSNVGKSSLLNALVGHRGLARISSTPGCTRGIHFYLLNRKVLFVDLPGYGYTRVGRSLQESWRPLVQSYLVGREPLRLVWHLVDSRHAPTEQDKQLVEWLGAEQIPFRIVLTKGDKLTQRERARCESRCREVLGLPAGEPLVPTSSKKRTGIPAIWKVIDDTIRGTSPGSNRATDGKGHPGAASAAGGGAGPVRR